MAERVVVTGIGIISALGRGKDAHIGSLRHSKGGVHEITHLRSVHAPEFVLGEINMSNDDLAEFIGLPTGDNGYTRTTLLSLAAMKELLAGVDISLLRAEP